MADQVAINMTALAPIAKEVFDSADGRKPRNSERESREVNSRHRTNGNNTHHHHQSGESDTDESYHNNRHHHHHHNGRRRSRSRSRTPSPSQSPSRRARRNVDAGQTPQTEKDIATATNDVEPLLVNKVPRKISQSEFDEDSTDEDRDHHNENNPQSGVDDGFFVGTRAPSNGDDPEKAFPTDGEGHRANHPTQTDPPNVPFAPGFNPNIVIDGNGNPQVMPDINVYQQKKNLAQGMMDLALLSANANQLRYILESYVRHPYYWFSVVSISISLILQVVVGVGLIMNSRYNVKNRDQICRADKINNFTVIGIFLITIVNVFVSAFGVADAPNK